MLTSRLLRFLASRARLALALGAVVAGAVIAVPVAAGTASAATGSARPGAAAVSRAAPPPATVVAVKCWTVSDCLAVGANAPQMATQLAAERWNGARWTRLAMPKPAAAAEVTIGALACQFRVECVAVGAGYPASAKSGSFAIADYWNGSRWTAARAASPGSDDVLAAVSCPAVKSCYAVGNYLPRSGSAFAPLVEHWNGATWTGESVAVPRGTRDGQLSAVSCSSARFCVAVGTDGSGVLIERWNGARWFMAAPRSVSSAGLDGVSCPTAASCVAVGSDLTARGGSLVERWNGRTWAASASPVPRNASYPGLLSVSCTSAARCLAVGDDANPGVYAVSWNGTGWHLVSMTATGARIGALYAVDCLAATSCVAIGATTQFAVSARSESAFWNGARWKAVRTA